MKKAITILLLSAIFPTILSGLCINAQNKQVVELKTVVIDAGHGGHDPGAVNGKVYEKDITLSVAKRLGDMIKRNYPGVKVVYTRSDDRFVELFRRAEDRALAGLSEHGRQGFTAMLLAVYNNITSEADNDKDGHDGEQQRQGEHKES